MDAWIGVAGTLLGAVVGGVAYLNGTRDRDLEARRDQEKRVTEVARELLQIVDARKGCVHGYLEVVGEFPHGGTPDGEEDPARKAVALLELYAPAPVTTAARKCVDLMDKWEARWTWQVTGKTSARPGSGTSRLSGRSSGRATPRRVPGCRSLRTAQ